MTLRTDLLPVFRDARQLVQALGLRSMRVVVRSRVWSGGKVRLGVPTDTDLEILPRPRCKETDANTIVVDKVQPKPAGVSFGYTRQQLRPDDDTATEYYYVVTADDGVERPYALV